MNAMLCRNVIRTKVHIVQFLQRMPDGNTPSQGKGGHTFLLNTLLTGKVCVLLNSGNNKVIVMPS